MKEQKRKTARAAKRSFACAKTTRRDLLKTIAAAAVFGSTAAPAPQSRASSSAEDLDTSSGEDGAAKAASWHSYTIKMLVYVPRIYDNNESRGSRKY